MTSPPLPDLEIARYRVVGAPQPELDDLAAVVSRLVHVPAVAINLMESHTQTTIATYGLDRGACSRDDSMCSALPGGDRAFQVADASHDARWAENVFVNGEREAFRFYAAVRLVSPRGVAVGTLCVFDHVARELSPEQMVLLERVASRVVDLLELHRRTHELETTVAELTAARVELQRSNEMLDMFTGQVAHDLRGPLTGLSMTLGTLREDLGDDQEGESAWLLDRALSSVKRMDTLIGDMLDFAALGSRPQDGQVDLAAVLVLVRADLDAALQGVRLVGDDLPVVSGGATQWRVVLQNLVANAAKFTRHLQSPLVRVCAGTDVGSWWLEVADNGPGVPVEDRERVFGLMEQGDPAQGGIGLGLATCARLVKAYGGTIVIGDAPEGGALVRITVPDDPHAVVQERSLTALV